MSEMKHIGWVIETRECKEDGLWVVHWDSTARTKSNAIETYNTYLYEFKPGCDVSYETGRRLGLARCVKVFKEVE